MEALDDMEHGTGGYGSTGTVTATVTPKGQGTSPAVVSLRLGPVTGACDRGLGRSARQPLRELCEAALQDAA